MASQDQPAGSSTCVDTATAGSSNSTLSKDEESLKSALNYLVHGKRHLLIKDIHSAIVSLGEACSIMSEVNGPLHMDNAEAHYYYGKALLEQARLDLQVFDGGPKVEGQEESEDSSDEEEEEGKESGDDDDEEKEETANGNSGEEEKEETMEDEEADKVEEKMEEDLNIPSPVVVSETIQDAQPGPSTSTSTSGSTTATAYVIDDQQPSTSQGVKATTEGEEEVGNLDLAWEVLDLSRMGYNDQFKALEAADFKTRGDIQRKLANTHLLLGEVATESENYNIAIAEFQTGLDLLKEIEKPDSREIAQCHFQMGLAYSFAKLFDESVDHFRKAVDIIQTRIENLIEEMAQKPAESKMPGKDGLLEEEREIQELRDLIPELQDKINDTLDAEKEAERAVKEDETEKEILLRNSPVKNPNPPVANDISHLVKKRKKEEEPTATETPPAKKLCPASDTNNTNGHDENNHQNVIT